MISFDTAAISQRRPSWTATKASDFQQVFHHPHYISFRPDTVRSRLLKLSPVFYGN